MRVPPTDDSFLISHILKQSKVMGLKATEEEIMLFLTFSISSMTLLKRSQTFSAGLEGVNRWRRIVLMSKNRYLSGNDGGGFKV